MVTIIRSVCWVPEKGKTNQWIENLSIISAKEIR